MEIFISYETESRDIADQLVNHFENNNMKCWYAPRDVLVSYASDIIEAISRCRIFLLILSGKSSFSKHVLNEVECAYKYFKTDKNIIIPFRVDESEISAEMSYYIQRLQFTDAYSVPMSQAIENLSKKINKIISKYQQDTNISTLKLTGNDPKVSDQEKRITIRYYDTDDNFENKRLKIEAKMLYKYELQVYNRLLTNRDNLNCLIINTLYAPGVMNKLNRTEIKNIIGLSYNEKACMAANYEYESDSVKFYLQDVEESDFEEKLERYMKERDVDGFDLVDITMAILGWKNPFRVIRIISHFLKPNAIIYVRDIDDSVVFAYPDKQNLFKHFLSLYKLNPLSGFRQSGRRIYGYLKKIGAKNVTLEYSGINTSSMNIKEVEDMFFCYFGFIPNDYRISNKQNPNNEAYKDVLIWLDENFADLEEAFLNDDFIYNSGYFIYTAKF